MLNEVHLTAPSTHLAQHPPEEADLQLHGAPVVLQQLVCRVGSWRAGAGAQQHCQPQELLQQMKSLRILQIHNTGFFNMCGPDGRPTCGPPRHPPLGGGGAHALPPAQKARGDAPQRIVEAAGAQG